MIAWPPSWKSWATSDFKTYLLRFVLKPIFPWYDLLFITRQSVLSSTTENNDVSSVNDFMFVYTTFAKSVMIRGNKGPGTGPRGTPAVTSVPEWAWPLGNNLYFLHFERQLRNLVVTNY